MNVTKEDVLFVRIFTVFRRQKNKFKRFYEVWAELINGSVVHLATFENLVDAVKFKKEIGG